MTGGVPRRSIFDHAKPHVGRLMVATFDVKGFFPSTNAVMVGSVLERLGFREAATDAVLRLAIKDDQLPQGSPISGFLANLALEPADRRIDAFCRKHDLAFTRYVDDIAISGDRDLRGFRSLVVDAVESCGYRLDAEKTDFMGRHKRQVVTKLVVNDKLRPTAEFISEVSEDIFECLAAGAAAIAAGKGVSVNKLKTSLTGKVQHIRRADGVEGAKLYGRLCGVEWTSVEAEYTGEPAYC